MAKKKLQFRPDRTQSSLWSKLYITPRQRKTILKWMLYSAVCVGTLVVQDVILSRFHLFGGTVDLTPMLLLLICVLEGAEVGGVFTLAASVFYYYSGSAPGTYVILLLTCLGIGAAMFRQNYLQRSFSAHWICAVAAFFAYQTGVFAVGVFLTHTHPGRFGAFMMNGLLGAVAVSLLYPALTAIGKIGGTPWKE